MQESGEKAEVSHKNHSKRDFLTFTKCSTALLAQSSADTAPEARCTIEALVSRTKAMIILADDV